MKKIAFICAAGLDQFIDLIIEGLLDDYIVRKFAIRTEQEIYNAINWADIIWFEWANEVAIIGTNYEGIKCKDIIIRLHSYEMFVDLPNHIKWEHVNKLILTDPHAEDILKELKPNIGKKSKIEIVYNGIDLDTIKWEERQPGYNIAWIGNINYKKNPQMMLQILSRLVDIDKRYKLHIAGSYQDSRYKIYLEYMIKEMGLQNNIKFYGWIDDMYAFCKDKNYLLHTSIYETFAYAIFEAMARGIKPVIHNFRGAKELYPSDAIFNTIDDACDKITEDRYTSTQYRDWIINKGWTLDNQIRHIKKIMEDI